MLTDLFFKINFSISIVASIIGLIFGLPTILIILFKCKGHHITNLLTCNTSVNVALYLIFNFISSIYGLEEYWATQQVACKFRAYGFVVSCTLLLYSHSVHAINRLFAVVFYKHKYLLTYRSHQLMIVINWLLGLILPIGVYFIDDNGYIYEQESRLCTCSTKKSLSALYGIITAFVIPFHIVVVIYSKIICLSRQSARRIQPEQIATITKYLTGINPKPNYRREMKLIRNTSILFSILLGGGMPYLILVLWHMMNIGTPFPSLYLLTINSISICTAMMMIKLFYLSKEVKKITYDYVKKLYVCIKSII
ncbi:hypothetical protein I4U23_012694 [Adineta vaga]|nr:hypothetical protein I4U23_012694 [Adineta vaga]